MRISVLTFKNRQSGVALVTGLIFMVVMTIIVIAALRSATLEERMAANARNRQVALQAAEAAVRDAEVEILAGGAPFDPFTKGDFGADCKATVATKGLCRKPASGDAPRWQNEAIWGDDTSRVAATAIDPDLVSAAPRYIVEIVNTPVRMAGMSTCPTVLYRITARGQGQDNSTVFVQTMVRHLPVGC